MWIYYLFIDLFLWFWMVEWNFIMKCTREDRLWWRWNEHCQIRGLVTSPAAWLAGGWWTHAVYIALCSVPCSKTGILQQRGWLIYRLAECILLNMSYEMSCQILPCRPAELCLFLPFPPLLLFLLTVFQPRFSIRPLRSLSEAETAAAAAPPAAAAISRSILTIGCEPKHTEE